MNQSEGIKYVPFDKDMKPGNIDYTDVNGSNTSI